MDNQYELTINLAKHLIDVPADPHNGRHNAECWLPIYTHPDPNPETGEDYQALDELEKKKYTWFMGALFFEEYFTVFDERPVIQEK